jgi:APA family basic amino acid/polyamine antiporter
MTSASTRKLGLWLATALVVGNMVGSGIFLLPSSLAQYGPISLVGWALTATGAVLLALVFARLGRAYPDTGGPYAYSRRAFGDFVGFQTAWGYWIAIWAGNAAIAVAFVGYLGEFWGALGDSALLSAGVALAAIWFLTWVNALGVRQGGMVQAATTVIKLIPLLAMATLGFLFIKSGNFGPFNATEGSIWSVVTAAAPLTLWAFIGLESATVPAGDLKDPERTIPLSTVIGTLIVAALYIAGTVAIMGIVPAATLAESTAPYSDAAKEMFGSWAGRAVTVGVVVSTFGALNGWILLQGQVPMAAARDRLFPAVFGATSRRGVPVFGLVISSALVSGLMFMNYNASLIDQFNFIILLATLTTLLPYAYSAMAEVMLLSTDRAAFSRGRLVRYTTIAVLAFAYSVWAIYGSGADVVLKGTVLLLAGIPVFVWMKWQQARPATGGLAAGAPAGE